MDVLHVRPVDSFFFKGHGQAMAGSDTMMSGIFPPRPSTVYGALRSAWINQKCGFDVFQKAENNDVLEWMGTPEQAGAFSMLAFFLHNGHEPLLPISLDRQVVEEEQRLVARPLILKPGSVRTSQSSRWLLSVQINKQEKSKSAENKYLSLTDWKKSMLSGETSAPLLTLENILQSYKKLGIYVDPEHHTVKKNYLYRLDLLLMCPDYHLAVFADKCPDFSDVRFLRLGGENRPWTLQHAEESLPLWDRADIDNIRDQLLDTGIGRIVLLSPAIWSQGSRPESFDQSDETLTLPNGLKVKTKAWAVGRPQLYGGWDIAKKRPKPRKNMVPAGSVIYVKIEKDQIDQFLELAGGFNFSDELAQQGYGFATICSYINHE